jgi:ankyrin repeat protein
MTEAIAEWFTSPAVSVLLESPDADRGTLRVLIFSLAMVQNRVDVVDWIISLYPDININALLFDAALAGGHVDVLKYLIDKGADINAKNTEEGMRDQTVMFLLAADGNVKTMRWLKQEYGTRVDIDAKDCNGRTPLFLAVISKKTESVECLAALGANLNAEDHAGATPMCFAAAMGNTEIIECLVRKGANVDAKGSKGITPLFYAIKDDQPTSIECLAKLGADLKTVMNIDGMPPMSPIVFAIICGHVKCIKSLVRHGVDVNGDIGNGMTPMFFASASGQIAVMKCLKELGANINAKTGEGTTPLLLAESEGQAEAAAWLRANGAK